MYGTMNLKLDDISQRMVKAKEVVSKLTLQVSFER
jgi:hypothetical protein